MAGDDETQTGEVALTGPGGVGMRAKGYRLMDIAWIILGAAVIWGAWEQKSHAGDSAQQSAAIVKSINDANLAVVQSIKESNAATVKALEAFAAEQKKATLQITIGNCMNSPAMRNRNDAREECRRIVRDDR
jgi:hypothetical protein